MRCVVKNIFRFVIITYCLSISLDAQTTVSAVFPAKHALNVPASTTIQVTFSSAMMAGSFNDTTSFIVSGMTSGRHRGTIVLSAGNTIATFTPTVAFATGEIVTVDLTSNLQDAGSVAIAPFVYLFTVNTTGASGTYATKVDYSTSVNNQSYATGLFVYDVDGDADGDIVVINDLEEDINNQKLVSITIMENNGNGIFTSCRGCYTLVSGSEISYVTSVFVSDVDGDGDGDIVVTGYGTGTSIPGPFDGWVRVLKNNGNGGFATAVVYGTGTFPTSVFISDIDGDGDNDIAVGRFSNTVSILKNNGDGTFASAVDYSTGSNAAYSVVINDVDGDGDGDIAVADYDSTGGVSILKNNGDGTFAAAIEYASGSNSFRLFISDVDGDGDADIITANASSQTVSVLKNNGDGTFATNVEYTTGGSAESVFIADGDGDGDGDVVAGNVGVATVSVLKNYGDGTYAAKKDFTTGGPAEAVFVSDVNGDGIADILSTNNSARTVSVLMGQPGPSVTTNSASNVGTTTATLNGTVNANNASTTVRFLYGTVSGTYTDSITATQSPVSGTTSTSVSASLSGLSEGTTYYFLVAATNADGYVQGGELSFSIPFTSPTVTTNAATTIGVTIATLNGTVNAHGSSTTVRFLYGTTSGTYSDSVTASQSPVTGSTNTSVSKSLSGLSANTEYYFRVAATNASGYVRGSELCFATGGSGFSDGSLDVDFNTTGKVTTLNSSGTASGSAVAKQSDGKILVVGTWFSGSTNDIAVLRYNSNGTLDAGFDGDGIAITDVGGDDRYPSVAIQNDGKIVVTASSSISDFVTIRYNSNGTLDSTFGGDGIVTTDVAGIDDESYSVVVQSDQKIVVGGVFHNGSNYHAAVVRYNSDGTLDTGFGGDGKVTASISGSQIDWCYQIALQSDGKIVLALHTYSSGSTGDVAVIRLNSDGSADTNFSGDGQVKTPISGADSYATSIVVQPDGKIVVAGTALVSGNDSLLVVRYNSDGSLDTGFSSDGIVMASLGKNISNPYSRVALQSDGKIVAIEGNGNDFLVWRYTCDGALDSDFDSDGKVATDISGLDNCADVTLQGDGKIVVAGSSYDGTNYFVSVVRYDLSTTSITDAGYALEFDGVDDYVSMGNTSAFSVGTSLTYEAWINPYSSHNGWIIAKWQAFAEDKQLILHGNRVYFYLYNVFNGQLLSTSSTVPFNQFTHIVATYGGGVAKLYVNGVLDTSKSVGSSASNGTGNLFIGANPDRAGESSVYPFHGIIDEVRIWNTERTQSEIQSTMHTPLAGGETGLVAYWKFDEGTGSITDDGSTNSNSGTISGATWIASTAPLPVELVSFSASQKHNGVELRWRTATEVNNYGFEIERKAMNNGQLSMNNWGKVGFVEGNGTTNVPKSYSFVDKNANGKILYRLKQIDRNGKFSYSQAVEVTIANAPKEFSLDQNYPNPFNPSTVISYQLPITNHVTLKVYDAIGREVATLVNEVKEAGSYSATFNASKLSSGIYFARLQQSSNSRMMKMNLIK